MQLPAKMQRPVEALNPAVDPNPLEPARPHAAAAHLANGAITALDRLPSLHSLVVALLLGAAGGFIAALWLTLIDAKGLVVVGS